MPAGLYGMSFNAIRRRIASAADSVLPGFNAIVASVDSVNRKCDLWVQGSPRVMKGVRYSTSLRNPPEYIKVRSAVYVRYANGSKLSIPEIEGPARAVPTIVAGTSQFPPHPPGPNGVLDGLQVVQWATPGQGVAITTGKIQFGGVIKEATVVKVGEVLNAKASGFTPGTMKVGQGAAVGNTYMTVPMTAPPTALSGFYRYDAIETDLNLVIKLIVGTASASPSIPTMTSGSIPLAYILRRPGIATIFDEDISLNVEAISGVVVILAASTRDPIPYSAVYSDFNPTDILVKVYDFNGILIIGHSLEAEIVGGSGTLGGAGVYRATAQTNTNGEAVFQYFRLNPNDDLLEHSPLIRIRSASADSESTIWITLLGSTGQIL